LDILIKNRRKSVRVGRGDGERGVNFCRGGTILIKNPEKKSFPKILTENTHP
jgi:hypothetical protein